MRNYVNHTRIYRYSAYRNGNDYRRGIRDQYVARMIHFKQGQGLIQASHLVGEFIDINFNTRNMYIFWNIWY